MSVWRGRGMRATEWRGSLCPTDTAKMDPDKAGADLSVPEK